MRKGRWAAGLLVLFLAAEFWIHGGLTRPAIVSESGVWATLVPGPYEATPGRFGGVDVLLPDAYGLPVLAAREGSLGLATTPAVPLRTMSIKGFGRLDLWGKKEPKLATLTRKGVARRIPLAPDGSAVLLTSSQGTIFTLDLNRAGAKPAPLLAGRIAGVTESTFAAKPPTGSWRPIWAEAPFFGASARTVYYFSNRLVKAPSSTMELWSVDRRGGKNTLLKVGPNLAAFGVDAKGRVILGNGSGGVYAVSGQVRKTLAQDLRPVALGPGGLHLLAEGVATDDLRVVDLVSDRTEKVPLGGDRFDGQASFSPDGTSLAVAVTDADNQGGVRVFRLTPSGVRLERAAHLPSGRRLVPQTPLSWLDDSHVVLVLADLRARLSTWVYGGSKGL